MQEARFSIINAAKAGFVFVGEHGSYLARMALIPVLIRFISMTFAMLYRPAATIIESFLWDLPAACAIGWFLFLLARLMLLGERRESLPLDPVFKAARTRALQISVIVYILFNMGFTTLSAALLLLMEDIEVSTGFFSSGIAVMILVVMLWGIRFSLLPVVAAVDYPLRGYLLKVHGFTFSLNMLALGALCALPVFFAFYFVISSLILDPRSLSTPEQVIVSAAGSVFVMLMTTVFYTSAIAALREIFGKSGGKGILA